MAESLCPSEILSFLKTHSGHCYPQKQFIKAFNSRNCAYFTNINTNLAKIWLQKLSTSPCPYLDQLSSDEIILTTLSHSRYPRILKFSSCFEEILLVYAWLVHLLDLLFSNPEHRTFLNVSSALPHCESLSEFLQSTPDSINSLWCRFHNSLKTLSIAARPHKGVQQLANETRIAKAYLFELANGKEVPFVTDSFILFWKEIGLILRKVETLSFGLYGKSYEVLPSTSALSVFDQELDVMIRELEDNLGEVECNQSDSINHDDLTIDEVEGQIPSIFDLAIDLCNCDFVFPEDEFFENQQIALEDLLKCNNIKII
ncbi:hypothetical protein P9112_005588 [Eukaryota sp. TZLM1-RC]